MSVGEAHGQPAALRLEGVTYSYPDATVPALSEIDLTIDEGEFCVAAGLSASGKSTLLRVACGLVPHFHGGTFGGRAVVAGLDTRRHGPGALAHAVGTLLQNPETQIVMGTVRAELAFPLELRGHSPAETARGVEETALALGIENLLERSTRELSGGELQRVALGAALAGRPRLVLLDEPTSQLDPVAGEELIGLLRRLNEEWGTAVLLVEHRLERCLQAADRVIALDAGQIVCDGSPRAFLEWAAERAPALQTPGARLLARAGLRPPPAGVKEARATLRAHGLLGGAPPPATPRPARAARPRRPACSFDRVWHEVRGGPAILRGVDLEVAAGERVVLMGRNGAGKSTLLRHAAGLLQATRGRVQSAGRVALLLQNPADYLVAETVAGELSAPALERAGLCSLAQRDPRDLSGGEQQRLALAIVRDGPEAPALLCLDEPTRGMDRAAKGLLADDLRTTSAAVLVATHDPEFASAWADRVLLMADGRLIADGPIEEILTGGWYFATETARIMNGAALTPERGAELLRRRMSLDVSP
ncbi:MAG: energy-coupling factor transporter ATPase [Solirubrobacteraceae bacterium]